MDSRVILLLLTAAIIHSVWNTLVKKSQDKQVFIWLSLVVFSIVFFIPFCFIFKPVSLSGWICLLLSGIFEALYFFLLGSAYQHGDLSLVYPLSRGLAPVFVTIVASIVLKETITWIGGCGIISIVLGIYILHIRELNAKGLLEPIFYIKQRASQLAILTGLSTAAYTTIDKVGLRYVDSYIILYFTSFFAAFSLVPYMVMKKRELIKMEWKVNKYKIAIVSILLSAAYFLVLLAMTSSKVSYVSAIREVSIVFGCFIGSFLLHEKFPGSKILGSILIFTGIALIAVS